MWMQVFELEKVQHGVDFIMQNNKGLAELYGCQKVSGSFSPTMVEPSRLKGVLECLICRGMHDVGIKLDAKIVVDGMFKLCSNISKLNVVFEDCKNLLQRELNFSLNYIFRNANKTTHVLLRHVATVFHFICWS